MTISIYTYTGNRDNQKEKPCHVAFKLIAEKDGEVVKETEPVVKETEGNWWGAAIKAIILALEQLTDPITCEWWIYTDTPYVEMNLDRAFEWRKSNWINKGKLRPHHSEWKELLSMIDQFKTRPHVSSGTTRIHHELIEAVKKVEA